jgi:Methane oxygenase PmoA
VSTPGAFSWFPPTMVVDDDQVLLAAQDCFVIFRYVTGPRPHVATLCGPSGRNLLEDSPVDHLHHRGLWWGHGDVNGVDFYLELGTGRGRIAHVEWRSIIDDAPRFGFVEALDWRAPTGEVVLTEERSVLLELGAGDHYTVDLASTYCALVDVAFGDTKEAALPGIRVAEVLTAAVGGTMRNARGQTGEESTFGQPAEWLDVSGERSLIYMGGRLVEGLACFDHPANPGHPNRWFTRGYGPVSPFPGHQFFDQRSLVAGATMTRRHRLVVHRGDAVESDLESHYLRYCQLA